MSAFDGVIWLGLACAVAGLVWHVVSRQQCRGCLQAGGLVGYTNLAPPAIWCYVLTLEAHTARITGILIPQAASASAVGVTLAVLAAAGAHATLLALLFRHRMVCKPCCVAGGGAFLAAAGVLLPNMALVPLAVGVVATTALGTWVGTRVLRKRAVQIARNQAKKAERELLAEVGVPVPGTARLVLYSRNGCPACSGFRSQVLAPLKHLFSDSLEVEERTAWKEMTVPTVVVLGRQSTHFVGARSLDEVSMAIQCACGPQLTLRPARDEVAAGALS